MCDDIAYDGIKVLAIKWGQNLFNIASFPSSTSFFLFILIYPRLKSNLFGVIAASNLLKYGFEEKGSSLCKCSILLGFFMSKKLDRLRSELLSEDKIKNLLDFLTK